ncbi:unnamed protein product [Caenorhabditis sp. 36 PRJEB53466]|nr:unnamed protein product [Caenorhabditis sp. 36 PRJEB53466]
MKLEEEADEDDTMLYYLIEKALDSDAIVPLDELWVEFRCHVAPRIHSMKELEPETRVRMLFVTRTPIDEHFLEELRAEAGAVIELDASGSLLKYEKEGLELKAPVESEIEDMQMLKFLAQRAQETECLLKMRDVWREYIGENGRLTERSLRKRFTKILAPRIHSMNEFSLETRVQMLFCSYSPIDSKFLQVLKERADVVLEEKRRIVWYREFAQDGLKLSIPGQYHSRQEDERMLQYLAVKARKTRKPMSMKVMWGQYTLNGFSHRTTTNLRFHFRQYLAPNIHQMAEFDVQTRALMLLASSTPVDAHFLRYLKRMSGFSEKGDIDIIDFVAEKAKAASSSTPFTLNTLWKEYKEKTGCRRPAYILSERLHYELAPHIHRMQRFDRETRIRMLFVIGTPVNEHFLEELRAEEGVEVELNERGAITKYTRNDQVILKFCDDKPSKVIVYTKQEDIDIMTFLAQKAENTTDRLVLEPLWREYVESGATNREARSLGERLRRVLAPKIHRLTEFDMETKVKLLFATSTSLDKPFLEFLRQRARVEVDGKGRIVEYEETGGLKLSKKYGEGTFTEKEDLELLRWLAERARKERRAMKMIALWRDYVTENGVNRAPNHLSARFRNQLAPRIHKLPNRLFDTETKLLMLFASKTPVNDAFLKVLNEKADILVDGSRRIVRYDGMKSTTGTDSENEESAEEKEEEEVEEVAPIRYNFSKEEEMEMLRYLIGRARIRKEKLSMVALWKEYVAEGQSFRSADSLLTRFRYHIAPKIHQMEEFDVETRVMLLFASKTPVDSEFLKMLKEQTTLEIDSFGRIVSFDGMDWVERDAQMLKCLAEHARKTRMSLNMNKFWSGYVLNGFSTSSASSISKRFREKIAPRIHLMTDFDVDTRVLMLFASNTPVDKQFLEDLRKDAEVEVDIFGRITLYRAFEKGGLELLLPFSPILPNAQTEDIEMIRFLADKSRETTRPLDMSMVWREFVVSGRTTRSLEVIRERFAELAPRIHQMGKFDVSTKARMLFASSTPVDKFFTVLMRDGAEVVLSAQRRILQYTEFAKGGLRLSVYQHSRNVFESEELRDMLAFLTEKFRGIRVPQQMVEVWEEYARSGRTKRPAWDVYRRFRAVAMRIPEIDDLDMETKVMILFGSSTPLQESFLIRLRRHAEVKVDKFSRIVCYKELGGLELRTKSEGPKVKRAKVEEVMEVKEEPVWEEDPIILTSSHQENSHLLEYFKQEELVKIEEPEYV